MNLLQKLVESVQLQGERLRNKKFLEASMAASALVATADGEVSFSERAAVDNVLNTVDAFKVFDVHDAVDLFSDFVEAIRQGSGPRQGGRHGRGWRHFPGTRNRPNWWCASAAPSAAPTASSRNRKRPKWPRSPSALDIEVPT